MPHEREITEEQVFLDRAHHAHELMIGEARSLRDSARVANMRGFADLVDRDVVMTTALHRIEQLSIGDQPLFFGRIDYNANGHGEGAQYHVGRLAVSDEQMNPLVIDWRAPVAEPFYRATGVESLGLARRRHISIRDRVVLGVEDEYFTDEHGELALPESEVRTATDEGLIDGGLALGGPGALLAALGRARTGRMGDIVATIQGEQDRIIRAPAAGILLVQGGPGTGKTAVALHRAAYLLYTHRGTLERQGVLVVGPNPLFLDYIENVLPSLGESGVTLSTLSGLVTNVVVRADESEDLAQLKGDERMVAFLQRAVRIRQRPLREDLRMPFGSATLVLRAKETAEAIDRARRRPGNHNQRRSALGRELALRLSQQYQRRAGLEVAGGSDMISETADQIRNITLFKEAMQRMWPRLSGQELLHDLFGAPALIRAAGQGLLTEDEMVLLERPRSENLSDVPWTDADAALIDEARVLLGPRRRPRPPRPTETAESILGVDLESYRGEIRQAALREASRLVAARADELDEAEFATFGHIVVDEAQGLSVMQLRVLKRRDLTGSMTIVGDMAQATTAGSSASWATTLKVLDPRREPTRVTLTVSYRTPEEVLDFARHTLEAAAPDLDPPRPVRRSGFAPRIVPVDSESVIDVLARVGQEETEAVGLGRVAILVTGRRVAEIVAGLAARGLPAIDPRAVGSDGLAAPLVVIAAEGANGLEFDAAIVVEPAQIAARGGADGIETPRGLRTLYVALTRPTRRLCVVHESSLPSTLRPLVGASNVASARPNQLESKP